MPGVFTSRGCVACRKQKKKCESENEVPPCFRCKRLNINCIGLGQRRFKFQDESEKVISIHSEKNVSDELYIQRRQQAAKGNYRSLIFNIPSSAVTRLTAAFVRGIDPDADISIHLPWNFGPYLEDVPRHLGVNHALDAATDAIIAGYTCLLSRNRVAEDQHSLRKYSKALKALAETLTEPQSATQSETLCAIQMLMMFESIAGFAASGMISHAGGAAKIFKARGYTWPKDDFEAKILLSLRGSVVIQSVFLTHSYFTAEEWDGITQSSLGEGSCEEQSFRCFALYARHFQRARQLQAAWNSGEFVPNLAFATLEADTDDLRLTHSPLLEALRKRFWSMNSAIHTGPEAVERSVAASLEQTPVIPDARTKAHWTINVLHAHIGRSYGVGIACQILLNALLLAVRTQRARANGAVFVSEDETSKQNQQFEKALEVEQVYLACEACRLATAVSRHRPLGTIYVAFMLRVAYVGAEDVDLGGFDGKLTHSGSFLDTEDPFADLTIPPNQDSSEGLRSLQSLADALDSGMSLETHIRQLLRSYITDFEKPDTENEAQADVMLTGMLTWLRDLFTLRLKEPTWVEKEDLGAPG